MKRIIAILLTMVLLSACGNAKSHASDKALSCAESAIGIGNDYIGNKIDRDTAVSKLDSLREEIEKIDSGDSHHAYDFILSGDILLISHDITMLGLGDSSFSKLKSDISKTKEDMRK